MKITQHLLAHKKTYFAIAVIWTGIVTYYCLKDGLTLPTVLPKHADKVGHAVFHFGIVVFWFFALKARFYGSSTAVVLKKCILISVIFGIVIEGYQSFFTATRSADWRDVLANCTGTIIASLLVFIIRTRFYKSVD